MFRSAVSKIVAAAAPRQALAARQRVMFMTSSAPTLQDVISEALKEKGLEQSIPRVLQSFEENLVNSLVVASRISTEEFREMNIKVGERHIIKDAVASALVDSGVRPITRSYSRGECKARTISVLSEHENAECIFSTAATTAATAATTAATTTTTTTTTKKKNERCVYIIINNTIKTQPFSSSTSTTSFSSSVAESCLLSMRRRL